MKKIILNLSAILSVSFILLHNALLADEIFILPVDNDPIDRTNSDKLNSYADVLKLATPAVVSVTVSQIVRDYRNPVEEYFKWYYGVPSERSEGERNTQPEERKFIQGAGSGVIVTSDGYLLTNNHVISGPRGRGADEIMVTLADGREFKAEIIGTDRQTDIAVLKINAEDLPVVKVADSDNIEVGDIVFAVGNPLGVGLSVSQGIISATGRIFRMSQFENFIQTDAAINMGNSGGALIDSSGRLIGINSTIVSGTGGSIGLGFSIPVNLAKNVMEQLINKGDVSRGFLGIGIADMTQELAEADGLENTDGIIVTGVAEDSAAERAGIKHGDIILAVDGKAVRNVNQLRLRISQILPGTETLIDFSRDGKREHVKVILGDLNSATQMTSRREAELVTGVSISRLTDELRKKYNVPDERDGVMIIRIEQKSSPSRNLSAGMLILEINSREVRTVAQAREALRNGMNKIYIYYNEQTRYVAIRGN